jgi:hypothetical protein
LKRLRKEYGLKKNFQEIYEIVSNKYKHSKKRPLKETNIQYVRYLYDFLIGVIGSRKDAVQIRNDLNSFIKSNLHLEIKKDNVVHRNEKSVKFLDHLVGFREHALKTSIIPKSICAAKKNKNKSISRFLESDKRLAKSKGYQFYSNVIKQFDILSSKLNTSVSDKLHVNVLSSLIAYKYIGSQLMKKLSMSD